MFAALRRPLAAVCVVAASLSAPVSVSAAPPVTDPTAVPASSPEQAPTGPATVSEAMVAFYADRAALSIGEFAARHGDVLTSFGLDPASLSGGFPVLPTAGDPFAALRARAEEPLPTLEGAVIGQGSAWASALATWAAGPRDLQAPSLGRLSGPSVAAVAAPEGFGTGVFLERSLTRLIADHPGVFAQVRAAGVGSPAAGQAWRESMLSAYTTVNGPRWQELVDPCSAAYLGAMASGSAATGRKVAGDSCNPCVVAGLYMHGQMGRLFDPGSTSTLFDTEDGLLPPAEWSSLPDWQRDIIAGQNPSLSEQLNRSAGGSSTVTGGCSGSRAAIGAAAPSVLPGVWSNLQP